MYAKIFATLYEGTMRGRAHEILVFTNMLAYANKQGVFDRHPRTIAEDVGLTVDEVRAALRCLEAPDPESRSPEHGGRRILRLDEHREWGLQIVNHGKYRAIRNEEERAIQNREAQRRFKEKRKAAALSVADIADGNEGKQNKPMQYASASVSDSGSVVLGSAEGGVAARDEALRGVTDLPTTAGTVTPSQRFSMRSTVSPIFEGLPKARQINRMAFMDECIAALGRGATPSGLVEAFRGYYSSPDGTGAYCRNATTLLANDFWLEPPEAWEGRKAETGQVSERDAKIRAKLDAMKGNPTGGPT